MGDTDVSCTSRIHKGSKFYLRHVIYFDHYSCIVCWLAYWLTSLIFFFSNSLQRRDGIADVNEFQSGQCERPERTNEFLSSTPVEQKQTVAIEGVYCAVHSLNGMKLIMATKCATFNRARSGKFRNEVFECTNVCTFSLVQGDHIQDQHVSMGVSSNGFEQKYFLDKVGVTLPSSAGWQYELPQILWCSL